MKVFAYAVVTRKLKVVHHYTSKKMSFYPHVVICTGNRFIDLSELHEALSERCFRNEKAQTKSNLDHLRNYLSDPRRMLFRVPVKLRAIQELLRMGNGRASVIQRDLEEIDQLEPLCEEPQELLDLVHEQRETRRDIIALLQQRILPDASEADAMSLYKRCGPETVEGLREVLKMSPEVRGELVDIESVTDSVCEALIRQVIRKEQAALFGG